MKFLNRVRILNINLVHIQYSTSNTNLVDIQYQISIWWIFRIQDEIFEKILILNINLLDMRYSNVNITHLKF